MSEIKTCVSLYSLQDEYLNHRMDLKDIMHFVKDNGVQGVEILPDQMLKGAPDISDETVAKWHELLKETGLTPVIAHPERYAFLQHRMQREQLLGRLLDAGCKFQLNLLSLTGWHGEHAKKLAEELIRRDLYTFVGTDLHSFPHLNAIETLSVESRQAEAVEKLKENNLLLWQ